MQQQETINIQEINEKISDLENYFLEILKNKNPSEYDKFKLEIETDQ